MERRSDDEKFRQLRLVVSVATTVVRFKTMRSLCLIQYGVDRSRRCQFEVITGQQGPPLDQVLQQVGKRAYGVLSLFV